MLILYLQLYVILAEKTNYRKCTGSKSELYTRKNLDCYISYMQGNTCDISNDGLIFISQDMFEETNCRIFLTSLRFYLKKRYMTEMVSSFTETFSWFYYHFNGNDQKRTMCLAYMIFGTSGFKKMISPGDQKYRGRGFLQIATEENYVLASDNTHDYLKDPEKLGEFSVCAMKAALKIFHLFTKDVEISFSEIVFALKPRDTEKYAIGCEYTDNIYRNRLKVYEELCGVFDLCPVIGERRYYN